MAENSNTLSGKPFNMYYLNVEGEIERNAYIQNASNGILIGREKSSYNLYFVNDQSMVYPLADVSYLQSIDNIIKVKNSDDDLKTNFSLEYNKAYLKDNGGLDIRVDEITKEVKKDSKFTSLFDSVDNNIKLIADLQTKYNDLYKKYEELQVTISRLDIDKIEYTKEFRYDCKIQYSGSQFCQKSKLDTKYISDNDTITFIKYEKNEIEKFDKRNIIENYDYNSDYYMGLLLNFNNKNLYTSYYNIELNNTYIRNDGNIELLNIIPSNDYNSQPPLHSSRDEKFFNEINRVPSDRSIEKICSVTARQTTLTSKINSVADEYFDTCIRNGGISYISYLNRNTLKYDYIYMVDCDKVFSTPHIDNLTGASYYNAYLHLGFNHNYSNIPYKEEDSLKTKYYNEYDPYIVKLYNPYLSGISTKNYLDMEERDYHTNDYLENLGNLTININNTNYNTDNNFCTDTKLLYVVEYNYENFSTNSQYLVGEIYRKGGGNSIDLNLPKEVSISNTSYNTSYMTYSVNYKSIEFFPISRYDENVSIKNNNTHINNNDNFVDSNNISFCYIDKLKDNYTFVGTNTDNIYNNIISNFIENNEDLRCLFIDEFVNADYYNELLNFGFNIPHKSLKYSMAYIDISNSIFEYNDEMNYNYEKIYIDKDRSNVSRIRLNINNIRDNDHRKHIYINNNRSSNRHTGIINVYYPSEITDNGDIKYSNIDFSYYKISINII